MKEFSQKLHSQLPPARLWGFNGMFLGPTISVPSSQPITVNWVNELPNTHIFGNANDPTIHGSESFRPPVRNVVHLHGARVAPDSDGYPESWFTPGNSRLYTYTNQQPATMLWYHDHSLGITRLNDYAGLAALYVIRDNVEAGLGLPMGLPYEVPLVLMDRWLEYAADRSGYTGNLLYPCPANEANQPPILLDPNNGFQAYNASPHHPIWSTEVWADTPLVNGWIMPYLAVEPRIYRFRILNASNSRFFNLRFQKQSDKSLLPIRVIGREQGFMPAPATVNAILVANAERYDVLVDFSGVSQSDSVILTNDAPAPYPDGGGGPDVPQIMQFRMTPSTSSATFSIPATLTAPILYNDDVVFYRDIRLDEIEDDDEDESHDPDMIPLADPDTETGAPVIGLLELKHWSDPVSVKVRSGSTEVWRFINATPDTHPMHVHLVRFRVLDRQIFNSEKMKDLNVVDYADGDPDSPTLGKILPWTPADPTEFNAPKDVVRVEKNTITRVMMKFDLPPDAVLTNPLQYVFHCHILEHEDNEMMRPFQVIPTAGPPPVTTDVTASVKVTTGGFTLSKLTHTYNVTVTVKNIGTQPITGPLQCIFKNVPATVRVANANGMYKGDEFISVPGVTTLGVGESTAFAAEFNNPPGGRITFTPAIRSGSF